MQEITPNNAYEEITAGRAVGIDVREAQEWTAGHAEKVTWNAMSEFDVTSLPADMPLIFICRSGTRSGQVANTVSGEFPTVFNMTGGMKAWNEAGLPMVSENGTPEVA